jgi:chromate transport protein ChrA
MDGPGPAPTLRRLFAAFFGVGRSGFGGVLPWARRMLVEQRYWLGPTSLPTSSACASPCPVRTS